MPDVNTAAVTPAPESDDIGSAVRAAFEKHTEPAVAAEAPKADAPPVTAKPVETPAVDGKPVEKAAEAPKVDAPVVDTPALAPEVKARLDRIPVGWKGGAANWHALAPEVKQYIYDRNGHIDRELQQAAPAKQFADAMSQVFRPHEGFLRAQGVNPVGAAQYLMDGYMTLMTGTAAQRQQVIQNLATQAGVDMGTIQAAPQVDPEVADLKKQLHQVVAKLQHQEQTAHSAEEAQLHTELQEFEQAPGHEHYQMVRGQMGALLMAKQATGLQDAYDKACWAHPEIRASLMAQHEAQAAEKRKKEAEAAQRAAVSVPGAPTSTSAQSLGDMSLRQSLEHQFAVTGRV